MATSITLRSTKGSALTHDEMDTNLTNLQTTADAAVATGVTLTANKAEAAALGVANTDQNMGSFTGSTISDNVSAKAAIQALETAVETKANATAVGVTASAANMGTYTGATIPDNETAKQNLQSLETAVETKANASALGVTASAADMGTFTGSTIADSQTGKQALQALETAVETKANASALGVTASAANMGTYTGSTVSDNQTAKQNIQELETAVEARPITTAYASQSAGVVKMGYGLSGVASIRIGGNVPGTGALVIGGAGQKDGGNGAYLTNDYHPQSTQLQNTMTYGPTELVIYGNANSGIATGDGAGTLTISQGSGLPATAVGKDIYFAGSPYEVATVSGDGLTITLASGTPSGTHDYVYSWVTGSGTLSVSGTTGTRTTGDPLVKYGSNYTFNLNGSPQTVNSASGGETVTFASAPGNGTYSYTYELQVDTAGGPLVTGFRVQKVAGESEEGVGLFAGPDGYWLQSFNAGSGENYPVWFGSASEAVGELHATGKYFSLGGKAGVEAIRAVWVSSVVNRIEARGGATGNSASLATRSGTDTNVSFNVDMQGSGAFVISNNSFGRTLGQFGGTGNDYLTLSAVTGAPVIAAAGSSTNVNIAFTPKGSGTVQINSDALVTRSSANAALGIQSSGGSGRIYYLISTTGGSLSIYDGSGGGDRVVVDSGGNILLNGIAAATSAAKALHIANGTAPTADPSGGGVLYVEAGALKYRGSSGTVTTIANA